MATPAPQQKEPRHSQGIQNVRASTTSERFADHADGRLARVQFLKGNTSTRGAFAANDPLYEGPSRRQHKIGLLQTRRVYKSIQEIFKNGGEDISDDDIDQITIQKPTAPRFPFIILTLAIIKDLLDFPANLLVIGVPVSMMAAFAMNVVLFFWILGKVRFKGFRKRFIRWVLSRAWITALLEMIPFVQIVPVTTIFILMVHFKEKKIVKLFDLALEELRRSKYMP